MTRRPSIRRQIFETACDIALGRVPTRAEFTERVRSEETRMQATWDGSGETDYSFYSDPAYAWLLLNSWTVRSDTDVEVCLRSGLFSRPERVFDFHGGMGMSAVRIALEFPDATVFSHSEVPQHREWCAELARRFHCSDNVVQTDVIRPDCNVLLAQETLEHIKRPFDVLWDLLDVVRPTRYLDGTSFTLVSPGHHSAYEELVGYDHECRSVIEVVPRARAKRRLTTMLRARGFLPYWERLLDTKKPFNGHPNLWIGR